MVERKLPKLEVAGSTPVVRSLVVLLAVPAEDAVAVLRDGGHAPVSEEGGDSWVCRDSGLALWRGGDPERADGRWETFGVGARDYYAS